MSDVYMIHEPFCDALMPRKSTLIDRKGGRWSLASRDRAGNGVWRQQGGKRMTVEEMFDEGLAPLAYLLPTQPDDNEERNR